MDGCLYTAQTPLRPQKAPSPAETMFSSSESPHHFMKIRIHVALYLHPAISAYSNSPSTQIVGLRALKGLQDPKQ